MNASPVDAGLALQAADNQDLIQRKIQMDDLRKRTGDSRTKDQKLREACEGFESVFIQKLWEQMRKNVPKEGYLHSKDEETYQSMFDQEFAKKMASAGGIGLADMLYEQLNQKLGDRSRTTGAARTGLVVPDSASDSAKKLNTAITPPKGAGKADNLYSDLPDGAKTVEPEALEELAPDAKNTALLNQAISDLAGESGQTAEAPEKVLGKALEELRGESAQAASRTAQANPAAGETARMFSPQEGPRLSPEEARNRINQLRAKIHVDPGDGPKSMPRSAQAKRQDAKTRNIPGHVETSRTNAASAGAGRLPQEISGLSAPVNGRVINGFGWRGAAGAPGRAWHGGLDMQASAGEAVKAAKDGKIVFAGPRESYDSMVILEHEGGLRSYYGNAELTGAKAGDSVKSGAEFARVTPGGAGQAESAASNHLHFELRRGELALNPEQAFTNLTASL